MIGMERAGKKEFRLVLIPCPFQGHINPMLQLGTILYSKGFSITIAHPEFQFPDTSKHPHFTFLCLPNGSWNQPVSSANFAALLSCLNINCKAPLQGSLTRMIEEKSGDQDLRLCIIYDGIMHFVDEVAFELKLPSIIIRTSNPTNLLTYYAYPHLRKEGYFPLREANALDLVPGLQPLRFKDLPVYKFHQNVDVLKELIGATRNLRSSAAIIFNTTDFLEQSSLAQLQSHCQVPVFAIGPMHKMAPTSSGSLLHEDASCIEWLDMQANDSVLYVSLGSHASMNEKELVEMAWGLANSEQPFLWVIRPDSICNSDWPEILPQDYKETVGKRGYIVEWAPQKKILSHRAIGGFWSHCGWNSAVESISEGVPLICRPYFGDQRVNTRCLNHVWKVGIEFEGELERGKIEGAVRNLMQDEEGEEMRHRAVDLKEKAEESIKPGGSSYNSLNELVQFIMSLQIFQCLIYLVLLSISVWSLFTVMFEFPLIDFIKIVQFLREEGLRPLTFVLPSSSRLPTAYARWLDLGSSTYIQTGQQIHKSTSKFDSEFYFYFG